MYYSSVSTLASVRCLCAEPNYGNKRIASIDVRGAFNQSLSFEQMGKEHKYKYVVFTHPVTKEKLLYAARGPLYGEASAPRHWSDTLAEYLISEGFVRGLNETSTFYHPQRRLTLLAYVDDLLLSGEEADCRWFEQAIQTRFDCKPMLMLGAPGVEVLDHLGVELSQDATHTSLSLRSYIESIPDTLGLPIASFKPVSNPMQSDIDPDSPALTAAKRRIFMKACGCISWCCATVRCDAQLALSRAAQWMANPNDSAYQSVIRIISYLLHSADYKLKAPHKPLQPDPVNHHWEFYCDSDHSANTSDSKLRCTCGALAVLNGMPVLWSSSTPTVACHPKITEPICDMAVSVSEIYAAATANKKFMALQYAAEEQGLPWPKHGYILQQDNIASGLFCTKGHSKSRSRMKHLDLRMAWCKQLRDSSVMKSAYVRSEDNKSDLLTKLLPTAEFRRQRSRIMHG